jgi:hypothetical protein
MIQQAGFSDAALVAETGFNSSPNTKGVLFRAIKHNLQTQTSLSSSTHSDIEIGVMESDPKKEIGEQEE